MIVELLGPIVAITGFSITQILLIIIIIKLFLGD